MDTYQLMSYSFPILLLKNGQLCIVAIRSPPLEQRRERKAGNSAQRIPNSFMREDKPNYEN
jgi:hypothetical protein